MATEHKSHHKETEENKRKNMNNWKCSGNQFSFKPQSHGDAEN